MRIANKRKVRDGLRFFGCLSMSITYLPHLFVYLLGGGRKRLIDSDINVLKGQIDLSLPKMLALLYLLHNNRYYRTLFYHRIGPVASLLIGWYHPGDRYFTISKTTMIGEGMWIAHPYATVINASSIGNGFRCVHCTTIGFGNGGRPTIGNSVSLGASVTIVGNIKIGDNVTIGAGSVVVRDVPDNCVAVGNPAKVIKFLDKV